MKFQGSCATRHNDCYYNSYLECDRGERGGSTLFLYLFAPVEESETLSYVIWVRSGDLYLKQQFI